MQNGARNLSARRPKVLLQWTVFKNSCFRIFSMSVEVFRWIDTLACCVDRPTASLFTVPGMLPKLQQWTKAHRNTHSLARLTVTRTSLAFCSVYCCRSVADHASHPVALRHHLSFKVAVRVRSIAMQYGVRSKAHITHMAWSQ